MGKFRRILQIAVIALFFFKSSVSAQTFAAGADTVVRFTPGNGAPHGHSAEYFPKNVLGLPSKTAGEYTAETREEEICALNFGGEIVIGFKNSVIIDQPGPDFTVFENAFKSPIAPYIFAEPATIAVSRDGITFKEFPYDPLTLKGCAGLTPTYGSKNPLDPAESGGDSFDLSDIGMDSVRFIKITDITHILQPGHPFYQPVLTGFDLDAVVGLHLAFKTDDAFKSPILIENSVITIHAENLPQKGECEIFALDGRTVLKRSVVGTLQIPFAMLPTGVHILVVRIDGEQFTQKILIQ